MKRLGFIMVVAAAGVLAGLTMAGCASWGSCSSCKPDGKCHAMSPKHAYGEIDTVGLKSLMDAKTPVVIVDARSGKWDDGKRIPGAIVLTSESAQEAIEKAIPSKDALIVAYCTNLKCQASKQLAKKLVSLGYQHVLKDPEGIQGWVDAGYPVTHVEKPKP